MALTILDAFLRFFLGTRVGVALLVAGIVFVAADIHRARLDQRDWQARIALAAQAAAKRDADIAANTRAQVLTELAAENAAKTTAETQVKEFADALPVVPPDKDKICADYLRVGNSAEQLRLIAGEPAGRPASATRVPKARWPRLPATN